VARSARALGAGGGSPPSPGALGDEPYLDGDRFTAGDLMMATVLRFLRRTDIVTGDERLAAYVGRCSARPAFGRALAAQMADFKQAA
jgi:glutathione S-transferase